MKARKRVVTSGRGSATGKRTPTVRRIRPAIVPARPRSAATPSAAASPTARPAPPDQAGGQEEGPLELSVNLGRGLVLASPIVAASGPFGYGVEVADDVEIGRLGAVVTRGTSLRPRAGAPPPRMAATPAGLLHDVGRQNPGIDVVLERHEATWRTWRVPVILNVWGESVGEMVELARRLEGAVGIAGIELDLASPSAGRSASPFGEDEAAAASVTGAVRRVWDGSLIVKLIAVPEIRAVARAVAAAGADAISAIGAVDGLALAPDRRATIAAGASGGLSGPAIRPIALRAVHEIASAVRVPVIGVGGVSTLDDVLDFLAVGAVAVGVGVAALADPRLPVRLADELAAECRQRALAGHASLVNTVRRR